MLPIPDYSDEDLWEHSGFSNRLVLTEKGIFDLKGKIRSDQKENLQLYLPWVAAITGVIGTAFDSFNNSLGNVTGSTAFSIQAGAGGSWSGATYTSANAGTWTVTGTYSSKSATASLTVTAVVTNQMHVQSIVLSFQVFSNLVLVQATATIVDAAGNPVSGATVYGHWSGATSGIVSGITNSSGSVTFSTYWFKTSGQVFTLTVDDVQLGGWTYNAAANVVSSGSITI